MRLAKMLKLIGWYDKNCIVEILRYTEEGYYLVSFPGLIDHEKDDLNNLPIEKLKWLWAVMPADVETIQ